METARIVVDRFKAEKMWRKYQSHRHNQGPLDAEIERIYRMISKGKVVVRAFESIRAAGVNDAGLPRLALARADASTCYLTMYPNGGARMTTERWVDGRTAASRLFQFGEATFPRARHRHAEAMVPHIPPDIRPQRGLQNYHILFEAIWAPSPPVDPILLRRIGAGDTWLVVGAWNLTEVERAVMASRLGRR
jgi:hypothetical protein